MHYKYTFTFCTSYPDYLMLGFTFDPEQRRPIETTRDNLIREARGHAERILLGNGGDLGLLGSNQAYQQVWTRDSMICGLGLLGQFSRLINRYLTSDEYVYILLSMTNQVEETLRAQCAAVNASCAATNLRRASRVVSQLYARIMAPSGLQPTQFTLLVACAIAGAAPITALADALAMDRTTLTRNLRPLERQGLVRVAPGEDRRVRVVTLSEKGRAALAQALPLWEQAQAQVVATFGQERLDQALREAGALAALMRES